jgi:hypothetical protein
MLPESQEDIMFEDGNASRNVDIQEPSGFSPDPFLNRLSDYGPGSLQSDVPSASPPADVDVRCVLLPVLVFAITFT